ncbi:MAG: hypothetical protein Q9M45_05255 [Robiginitomaculum sp.]|nr:hypothetical protein [Robiginitomaculum sp.]
MARLPCWAELMEKQVKGIIETGAKTAARQRQFKKSGDLFASYMDTNHRMVGPASSR